MQYLIYILVPLFVSYTIATTDPYMHPKRRVLEFIVCLMLIGLFSWAVYYILNLRGN